MAGELIDKYRPGVLVLNAGATPLPRPIQHHTWETFSRNWDVDVAHVFHWTREALLAPLEPGSTVVTLSSGAALFGSPLAGGYAGAKAAIRFLTSYAADESRRAGLGIRFVSLLPQLTPATALGAVFAAAYAAREGAGRPPGAAPAGCSPRSSRRGVRPGHRPGPGPGCLPCHRRWPLPAALRPGPVTRRTRRTHMAGEASARAGLRSALWLPLFDDLADPVAVARLAAEAEEAGWHGFFVWDHLSWQAPVRQVADPWITLAAAAAATERLRLGPMVTPLARRRRPRSPGKPRPWTGSAADASRWASAWAATASAASSP